MANGRDQAHRGETVRLYNYFYENGVLADPYSAGVVDILDSTQLVISGLANITPTKLAVGTYYVEWDIPSTQLPSYHYDYWKNIKLTASSGNSVKLNTFPVLYGTDEEIPIPEEVAILSGLCRVYEFFVAGDGKPLEGVLATGKIIDLPQQSGEAFFVNYDEAVENYTDENGRVDWYFPRGSTVHIEVLSAAYSVIKTVPEQESIRIYNMEDA